MIRRSAFVLAVTLGVATSLFAASPVRQDSSQVAVDKNGNLRQPTAAEQRDLAAQSASAQPVRSFLRLEPKVHASGMVSIALDETYDHAYVVRTEEDGSLSFVCTTHDDASQFVASTASIDTIMRLKPATIAKQHRAAAERE
jgi:hypothetical protein